MTYSLAVELAKEFKAAFRAHLACRGLDADKLFGQAALLEEQCAGDDLPTLSDKFSHLWELALAATADPLLGLKLGAPRASAGAGLVSHILRVSTDVRGAIESLVCYLPLLSPTVHGSILRMPNRLRVELQLPAGLRPVPQQRYDFIWGLAIRALRNAAACDFLRPRLVTYAYPAPAMPQAYAEAFGCEVRFGMPVNAIEFDDAELTVPIATAGAKTDDWALRLLSDLAQSQRDWMSRMANRNEPSAPVFGFGARVQQILAGMLPKGEPLREEVARQLRMSERTLQRRLAEEGTNFTRLVDDTRREMAQRYLLNGQMSLKRLSFQLGFSDPSAFCRACKRWFGRSPKQLQQGPAPLALPSVPQVMPRPAMPAARSGDPKLFAAWPD